MSKKSSAAPHEKEPEEMNGAAETAEETKAAEAAETPEAPEAPEAEPKASPEEELKKALDAEKEKYLRLAAEYDNFRKRSQKEREALYADVRADTVLKLLPVYDNLSRALSQECSDSAFYKGVEMTMTQLRSIFEKMDITEIPAVGEKFDPALHNAVMHVEDDKYGEGEVVAEFEKGFKMGDRVIRFSTVQVAN